VNVTAVCYLKAIILWGVIGGFQCSKLSVKQQTFIQLKKKQSKYQANLSVSVVLSSAKYAKASTTDELNT